MTLKVSFSNSGRRRKGISFSVTRSWLALTLESAISVRHADMIGPLEVNSLRYPRGMIKG